MARARANLKFSIVLADKTYMSDTAIFLLGILASLFPPPNLTLEVQPEYDCEVTAQLGSRPETYPKVSLSGLNTDHAEAAADKLPVFTPPARLIALASMDGVALFTTENQGEKSATLRLEPTSKKLFITLSHSAFVAHCSAKTDPKSK